MSDPRKLDQQTLDDHARLYAPEAEAAVLGAALMDDAALEFALDFMRPGDFAKAAFRTTFEAMAELKAQGKPIDLVTVQNHLGATGRLELADGPVGLASLSEQVPSAANVEGYAQLVRDKSKLRKLLMVLQDGREFLYRNAYDANLVADQLAQSILDVSTEQRGSQSEAVANLILDYMHAIEARKAKPITALGPLTGLGKLDDLILGLQKGKLYIVGGRPGAGKTALLLNILLNVARQRVPCLLFSCEMTTDEILGRLLSIQSAVDSKKIRTGRLNDPEMGRVARAASLVYQLPITINDKSGIDIKELRGIARAWRNKNRNGVVFADYLGLITVSGRHDNRTQEVTAISGGLKALAKELSIPTVVAAQLNRDSEKAAAQPREPRLSDLRESGSIEQDADVVAFVHRPDMGTPRDDNGRIILAKQRDGETDGFDVQWNGACTTFSDFYQPQTPQQAVGA